MALQCRDHRGPGFSCGTKPLFRKTPRAKTSKRAPPLLGTQSTLPSTTCLGLRPATPRYKLAAPKRARHSSVGRCASSSCLSSQQLPEQSTTGLPSAIVTATAGQKRFSSDVAIFDMPCQSATFTEHCTGAVPAASSLPPPFKQRCISRLGHDNFGIDFEGASSDGPVGDITDVTALASQQCAEAPPVPSLLMPVKRRRLGRFVHKGLLKPGPSAHAVRDAVSPTVVTTPGPSIGSSFRNTAPLEDVPHVSWLARRLLRKLKPHPRSTRTSMLLPTASPCP